MFRKGLLVCWFVLAVIWFPATSTEASVMPGPTTPPRLSVKEVVDIDVTTIKGRSASLQKLIQHMRETGRYQAETGRPFISRGRWYLRFFRYASPMQYLAVPGMYWDAAGRCMRLKYNDAPAPGYYCSVRG